MRKLRLFAVVTLTCLLCFVLVPTAFAHPLGNFTINHYAGLQISRTAIAVDYVLDMAEIPAFQEITALDTNGSGQPDPDETEAYHPAKCRSLLADLDLRVDRRPAALALVSSAVAFPPGAGGLPTLRLTCNFTASMGIAAKGISFADNAYSERLGWREIVVKGDGISFTGDLSAHAASPSNRLTAYPNDMLASPLNQREISLGIGAAPAAAATAVASSTASESVPAPLRDRNDRFTRLILLENLTLPTILAALAVSFLWGAMHAMTPGHGKTIVAAYLVGSRGNPIHALYLGLTTTMTHTLGVFALGLITYFAARFIVPEQLYPWMSVLSGLFVLGIGANLLVARYRSSGLGSWLRKFKGSIVGQPRPGLVIQPVAGHSRADGSSSRHHYALSPGHDSHTHHTHGHEHIHVHAAGGSHDHDHTHLGAHSHLPPGADGAAVTWRSLLLLGISGGILPCPSALVVLLGAIALNRIGFGLVLVLVFSLGLAGALTVIGLLFIYAGRLFGRFPAQAAIVRIVPVFSALFIALAGMAITLRAFAQLGLIGS